MTLCALLSLTLLLVGCLAPKQENLGATAPQSSESARESERMNDVVFVVPLEGAPIRTALVLADAIAADIRDANHPSILAHEPNQAGASVVGRVLTADTRGDVIWLTLAWSIRAPYGTHVAEYQQNVVIDAMMWQQAAPEAINLVVADASPRIADMVRANVGPPIMSAMHRPSDRQSKQNAIPETPTETTMQTRMRLNQSSPPESAQVQQLAHISENTNGQVVMPKELAPPPVEASVDVPTETSGVQQASAPAPATQLPSLLDPAPSASAGSGPPRALTPGVTNVGLPPGGVASAPDKTEEESFLDKLSVNMSAEKRRDDDARPAGPGGAAFANVRWGQPSFLIKPVKGAPGNGNEALTVALKSALRDRDLTISEDPRQAGFIIQGAVDAGEPINGRQYVRISWLVNTVTGQEVGKAVQENTVVSGSLDGEWGHVAEVVSHAAVRGIKDLFGEADERLTSREPLPEFPDVSLPNLPGRAPPPPSSY